jgi:hypothetical protein
MKNLPQTQIIIPLLFKARRREAMVDPDILILAIVNASEGVSEMREGNRDQRFWKA